MRRGAQWEGQDLGRGGGGAHLKGVRRWAHREGGQGVRRVLGVVHRVLGVVQRVLGVGTWKGLSAGLTGPGVLAGEPSLPSLVGVWSPACWIISLRP